MVAALCFTLLFCTFFSGTSLASERLEDFLDLVKSIDAEAEKPAKTDSGSKKSETAGKDPGSKKNESSGTEPASKKKTTVSSNKKAEKKTASEEDRLREFAETARESEEGYEEEPEDDRLRDFAETARESEEGYDTEPGAADERLKEFAETAREAERGYESDSDLPDDRLVEFARTAGYSEDEYEKKYGPVIEDHVISDPSQYNDGDRVVPTSNTGRYATDTSSFRTSVIKDDIKTEEDEEDRTERVVSTKRIYNELFRKDKEPVMEEYNEDAEASVFYKDSVSLGIFTLTAYDACIICCGKTDGITATGTKAEVGRTIAVDPTVIPYNSRVMINGHVYTAEDAGSKIRGNTIDIFMSTHEEAKKFGRQSAEVFLLK